VERIRSLWTRLEAGQQEHVIDHMQSSDFPACREAFAAMAETAGWQLEWIWSGSHQAEGLLTLQRSN
jgi:hypothetical protein